MPVQAFVGKLFYGAGKEADDALAATVGVESGQAFIQLLQVGEGKAALLLHPGDEGGMLQKGFGVAMLRVGQLLPDVYGDVDEAGGEVLAQVAHGGAPAEGVDEFGDVGAL